MHLRPEELSKNVPEISLEGNFVALAFASTALEDNHFCPCLTNWAIRVFVFVILTEVRPMVPDDCMSGEAFEI